MRSIKFLIAIALIFVFPVFSHAVERTQTLPKLVVFFSPSCHKCMQVKAEVMPKIEKEYKEKIRIEYRDISDINNYSLMIALKERYKSDIELEIPVFFFEGKLLNAKGNLG